MMMDQQHVDRIVCDRLEAFADILGEEVGIIQRISDRKVAAESKRVQIAFAAVWEELNALRERIGKAHDEVARSPTTELDNSANVSVLKYARAS
jgi:hypothetical protein